MKWNKELNWIYACQHNLEEQLKSAFKNPVPGKVGRGAVEALHHVLLDPGVDVRVVVGGLIAPLSRFVQGHLSCQLDLEHF